MSQSSLEREVKTEQPDEYESPASPKREIPDVPESYRGLNSEELGLKPCLDEMREELDSVKELSSRCMKACLDMIEQVKNDFQEMKQQLATLKADQDRNRSSSDDSFSSNSSASSTAGPARFRRTREQGSSWYSRQNGHGDRRRVHNMLSSEDRRPVSSRWEHDTRHLSIHHRIEYSKDRSPQGYERRPFADTNIRGYPKKNASRESSYDSRSDRDDRLWK